MCCICWFQGAFRGESARPDKARGRTGGTHHLASTSLVRKIFVLTHWKMVHGRDWFQHQHHDLEVTAGQLELCLRAQGLRLDRGVLNRW